MNSRYGPWDHSGPSERKPTEAELKAEAQAEEKADHEQYEPDEEDFDRFGDRYERYLEGRA